MFWNIFGLPVSSRFKSDVLLAFFSLHRNKGFVGIKSGDEDT